MSPRRSQRGRSVSRDVLIDALRDVYDPCCADRKISIVDMGVVEDASCPRTSSRSAATLN